ncbi:hypothetical protein ACJ73_04274 [Blastomyces percursus]|uniref:Uncharacterized protein n=1 Tax=Blastomyces percursus TaxID=1658174 RepID=A0A1J9Q756_9EURO|nr:hypothetical protein ACJ73_04274 [Blastomyces percursus]
MELKAISVGGAAGHGRRDDSSENNDGRDSVRTVEAQTTETSTEEVIARRRAPRLCSVYRSAEHTARTCPHRG